MAIVQKDSVLQIRLPAELLDKYKQLCAEKLIPVSVKLRQHILYEVEQWERANERRLGGFAKVAQSPAPPVPAPAPQPVQRSSERSETGPKMSRQERREMERELKKGRF